jgi:geranylgeranyl diphosphate synthase type I
MTGRVAEVIALLRATAPPTSTRTGLMAAYHMGWAGPDGRPLADGAGKLLRPHLCLWACEAVGGEAAAALPVAAAVEWIHNFTLIHDDIQDGDVERHHRATVWSVWGVSQGINAGDALCALAFRGLLAPGPRPGRRLRAAHALAGAVLEVVEGQCLDLALEGRPGASPAAYLRMAAAKTGALFGASLEAGAIVGGASSATARRLRTAGRLLGQAFQIRDDWLGIWGDPDLTGKSRDGDLGRRKVSYPVVAAYRAMDPTRRRQFRLLFARPGPEPVSELRRRLEEAGAPELAQTAARELAWRAVAAVPDLSPERSNQFQELASYVANRTR